MTWSIESNIKVIILSLNYKWAFRDFRDEFLKYRDAKILPYDL